MSNAQVDKLTQERDYWKEKAQSQENTINKLTKAIEESLVPADKVEVGLEINKNTYYSMLEVMNVLNAIERLGFGFCKKGKKG